MNESDWLDEKRNVLSRLFDAAFERGGASGDQAKHDIPRRGAVKRHVDKDHNASSLDGGRI
jgi:hypothetical protein